MNLSPKSTYGQGKHLKDIMLEVYKQLDFFDSKIDKIGFLY